VPLLLSETRLNVPELPAVFEAMNAPELFRLVSLNVVTLLACNVPLFVTLVDVPVSVFWASKVPVLVRFVIV